MNRTAFFVLLVALSCTAQTMLVDVRNKVVPDGKFPNIAAAKDLLVRSVEDGTEVYRRNSNTRQYDLILKDDRYQRQGVTTNGIWFGFLENNPSTLFQVFANNTVSAPYSVPQTLVALVADDILIAKNRSFFMSFKFVNNQWKEMSSFVIAPNPRISPPAQSFHASNNAIVVASNFNETTVNVTIYKRQADASYIITESFNVFEGMYGTDVLYNDVDTVFLTYFDADPTGSGINGLIRVYTKSNDAWSLSSTITAANVTGIAAPANLGWFRAIVNQNAALFMARDDDKSTDFTAKGRAVLVTRKGGIWQPKATLLSTLESYATLGYYGIAVNDYDMFVTNEHASIAQTSVLALSNCALEPINVTCSAVTVQDCSALSLASYYTINNPQCGAVTVNQKKVTVAAPYVNSEFVFERQYVASASCTINVKCGNLNEFITSDAANIRTTSFIMGLIGSVVLF